MLSKRIKIAESFTTLEMTAIKLMKSTDVREVNFDIGPLLESFTVGDELELLLSGSAFPTLARNTLADENLYYDGFEKGEVCIVSSAESPSQISFYVR
ncbi:MAG: hypothetical protein J7501_09165 [Bdellovibrio sp.]|nr:hypothetical protein [Bdellovibrio sp.]